MDWGISCGGGVLLSGTQPPTPAKWLDGRGAGDLGVAEGQVGRPEILLTDDGRVDFWKPPDLVVDEGPGSPVMAVAVVGGRPASACSGRLTG
jgi:hypothetical protein